jgi:hypothetical protein
MTLPADVTPFVLQTFHRSRSVRNRSVGGSTGWQRANPRAACARGARSRRSRYRCTAHPLKSQSSTVIIPLANFDLAGLSSAEEVPLFRVLKDDTAPSKPSPTKCSAPAFTVATHCPFHNLFLRKWLYPNSSPDHHVERLRRGRGSFHRRSINRARL